jgi:hypothetical protein
LLLYRKKNVSKVMIYINYNIIMIGKLDIDKVSLFIGIATISGITWYIISDLERQKREIINLKKEVVSIKSLLSFQVNNAQQQQPIKHYQAQPQPGTATTITQYNAEIENKYLEQSEEEYDEEEYDEDISDEEEEYDIEEYDDDDSNSNSNSEGEGHECEIITNAKDNVTTEDEDEDEDEPDVKVVQSRVALLQQQAPPPPPPPPPPSKTPASAPTPTSTPAPVVSLLKPRCEYAYKSSSITCPKPQSNSSIYCTQHKHQVIASEKRKALKEKKVQDEEEEEEEESN